MPRYMALKDQGGGNFEVVADNEDRKEVSSQLKEKAEHGSFLLVSCLEDLEVGPPKREASTVVRSTNKYSTRAKNGSEAGAE